MFHLILSIDEHGNPEGRACTCGLDADHDTSGERVDR